MRKPSGSIKEQLFDLETGNSRILGVLFTYPYTEFTLSELAKQAHVSKSTASGILSDLKMEGVITTINLGIVWRIRANYENINYKKVKIIHNLSIIFKSRIAEYLDQKFHPKNIILFGSFRKGEDGPDSDIDIAIETDENKEPEILSFEEFKKIEAQLHRKIRIYKFNRKKIDLNLFNNIANGIVLHGFLEVRP